MKVEEERDQKTEHFVQAAKEICGRYYSFPCTSKNLTNN
jgi:hypothetical protein